VVDVRRRVLGGAALVLVVGVAVVLAAGSGGASGPGPSAKATGTGTVERRMLAERLTATGTIGYAGETTVLGRLAGTVTSLPAVGDTVRRGEPLYAVSGRPVVLMYGRVPPYRTLAEGVGAGKDVEELERNLAALGYAPGNVDGHFTYETAAAIRAWQEDVGLKATGEVELGRVAFLPGPQRVTALAATLGEGLLGSSPPVLRTSSTRRVVSVELAADQQSVAHRGQRVEVVLPGGAEAPGRVSGLAAVEPPRGASPPGEEPEPSMEATIVLTGQRRIPALDGATVNVLFTQRVRKDVLSVPLTALLAIGGERFAVDVVDPHGARRRIVVTPGLAADGYAEVTGKGLRAGMTVETGR
jgi:peptidoglycan hydrolase-like protein with peptidoglycan-binding domain